MASLIRWEKSTHTQIGVMLALATTASVLCALLFFLGPPSVPLWYSLVGEKDQLTGQAQLIFPLFLAWSIVLFCVWFSRKTELEHNEYFAQVSLWSGIAMLVFLNMAFLRIVKILL